MWIPLDDESANDQKEENKTQESVLTIQDTESDHNDDATTTDHDVDNPNDTDSEDSHENYSQYGVVAYCSCKAFWTSRPGHIALYIVFTLLLVAALVAFCVVIRMIVVPYCKVSLFQRTNCTVVGVWQQLIESHCSCTGGNKGCDGQYMCLSINVQFPDERGTLHNASISDNEVLLGENCSFFPDCKATYNANLREMKEYEEAHARLSQLYPCLYNPMNYHQVIRTRRFQLHHVVHGLVWSSAFLVTMIVVLIFVFMKFKSYETVENDSGL